MMAGQPGRSGGLRDNLYGHDLTPSDGGPVKPSGLLKKVSDEFDRLLKRLPVEALREVDSYLLVELATLIVGMEQLNTDWLANPSDKDIRTSYMQALDKIMQLSNKYGLTPADRKRIKIVDPKQPEDDLKEFL